MHHLASMVPGAHGPVTIFWPPSEWPTAKPASIAGGSPCVSFLRSFTPYSVGNCTHPCRVGVALTRHDLRATKHILSVAACVSLILCMSCLVFRTFYLLSCPSCFFVVMFNVLLGSTSLCLANDAFPAIYSISRLLNAAMAHRAILLSTFHLSLKGKVVTPHFKGDFAVSSLQLGPVDIGPPSKVGIYDACSKVRLKYFATTVPCLLLLQSQSNGVSVGSQSRGAPKGPSNPKEPGSKERRMKQNGVRAIREKQLKIIKDFKLSAHPRKESKLAEQSDFGISSV